MGVSVDETDLDPGEDYLIGIRSGVVHLRGDGDHPLCTHAGMYPGSWEAISFDEIDDDAEFCSLCHRKNGDGLVNVCPFCGESVYSLAWHLREDDCRE